MALTDNLVAYYKFDEPSGTTATNSTGSDNGTIGASLTINQTGKLGKAYLFANAANDRVTLPSNANFQMGTSDFTFTAWIYPNSIPTGALWKGIFGGDSNCAVFGMYDSILNVAKNGVAGAPASGLTCTNNTWQFVAITFDSTATTSNLTYYRNASSATVNFDYNFDSGYTNLIGQVSSGLNIWQGLIDEVGMWKRKLSGTEISTIYNGGNGLTYPFSVGFSMDAKRFKFLTY